MKKLFAILIVTIMMFSITGCDLLENLNKQVDSKDKNIMESEKEKEANTPTPIISVSTLKDCPQTDAKILDSGYCTDKCQWTLYEDGLLCVYGSGAMFSAPNRADVKWYQYKDIIKSVHIGSGITTVGTYAFTECPQLESIVLPYGLKTIQLNSISCCPKLKEIELPDSLEQIEYWGVADCDGLEKIVIPGSIKHVDNYAFQGCDNVKTLIVSDGVESIGFDVFEKNTMLEYIYLSKDIKSIDVYTFRGCEKIKCVYYGGSYEQWQKIAIKETGNEKILNATIYFDSTQDAVERIHKKQT